MTAQDNSKESSLEPTAPIAEDASGSPTIDLELNSWEEIKKAASESPWIPQEHYFQSDWVSDVCAFLREPGAVRANTVLAPQMATALRDIIQAAEVALDNSHWEVRYGSADLAAAIQRGKKCLSENGPKSSTTAGASSENSSSSSPAGQEEGEWVIRHENMIYRVGDGEFIALIGREEVRERLVAVHNASLREKEARLK